MIDFTKEELDYLCDILKIHINDYPTPTSRDYDFLRKIQSMIDSYCEHTHKQYYEHVPVYECTNCQMVMLR